ncbi:MAG TPA: hypothetical protein VM165_15025, partial [Planctomycetaceae bacterium]|nr:hypothetical protein [Planctomycetaceae bacterium]
HRGAANVGSGTFGSPYSTLAYAFSQCSANRGDIIVIKPGHAETISSASALTLSIAGVAIVGLGLGSSRPTFTLDTAATATINVTAANVSIQNCIFTANFADIVSVFTLTTAKYFTLERCYIKATATNMNFLNVIDTNATTADADGLYVSGCKWIEPDLATLGFVKMDGTNADIVFSENFLVLGVNNNVASCFAIATGKVITALRMEDNRLYRLNTDTATGGVLITTDGSTNTGVIARNFVQTADTAGEVLVTASSGFGFFENRESGVAGATGYVLPVVDS